MRRFALLLVLFQAILVGAFAFAVRSGKIPLGVPGEWEWQRVRVSADALSMVVGLTAILLFAGFAAAGFLALGRSSSSKKEGLWLVGLTLASIGVQGVVQESAPDGYGLSKWIFALYSPGASGYYTVAKREMADPSRFLADYPGWIARQDALHVGTHPPGLFVVAKAMLGTMEANPRWVRSVVAMAPPSVSDALIFYRETKELPKADGASLAMTGALTLMLCSLTVVPLYLLARNSLPASSAWVSACLWPLVPSSLMFQPTADTAFPFLSTAALAMACWAGRLGGFRGFTLATLSGLTMALGMFFTLAFLPVGLVVALVIGSMNGQSWRKKAGLIAATGLGFLAGTAAWWWATSANPLAIWWVNQKNHGRFYVEYPRSYWAWAFENPVELTIALGLPSTVWAISGFRSGSQAPRVALATLLVLAVLTISGKNLSEVARLWLPLMPPLLVAAGSGFARVGGKAGELAGSVALMGLQVLILEATIQVVYPV